MATNSICSAYTFSTRSMVASSSTCGRAFARVNVARCSRVSSREVSIMLAISAIWLIGCQFTWSLAGMLGSTGSGGDGLRGYFGPPSGRLEVASIGNDVSMCQGRDPCQVHILHRMPGGPQLIDDVGDVDRVPDQHRVGEKAEAAGLVHHLFVVAGTEAAPIGEEQRFGEGVTELAAVKLELDGVTKRLFLDISQDYVEYGRQEKNPNS